MRRFENLIFRNIFGKLHNIYYFLPKITFIYEKVLFVHHLMFAGLELQK